MRRRWASRAAADSEPDQAAEHGRKNAQSTTCDGGQSQQQEDGERKPRQCAFDEESQSVAFRDQPVSQKQECQTTGGDERDNVATA
jgi:hypothetical protein